MVPCSPRTGISGKSQILFALVFTTRYLDLVYNFISIYNTVMKVRAWGGGMGWGGGAGGLCCVGKFQARGGALAPDLLTRAFQVRASVRFPQGQGGTYI